MSSSDVVVTWTCSQLMIWLECRADIRSWWSRTSLGNMGLLINVHTCYEVGWGEVLGQTWTVCTLSWTTILAGCFLPVGCSQTSGHGFVKDYYAFVYFVDNSVFSLLECLLKCFIPIGCFALFQQVSLSIRFCGVGNSTMSLIYLLHGRTELLVISKPANSALSWAKYRADWQLEKSYFW